MRFGETRFKEEGCKNIVAFPFPGLKPRATKNEVLSGLSTTALTHSWQEGSMGVVVPTGLCF